MSIQFVTISSPRASRLQTTTQTLHNRHRQRQRVSGLAQHRTRFNFTLRLRALTVSRTRPVVLALLNLISSFRTMGILSLTNTIFTRRTAILNGIRQSRQPLSRHRNRHTSRRRRRHHMTSRPESRRINFTTLRFILKNMTSRTSHMTRFIRSQVTDVSTHHAAGTFRLRAITSISTNQARLRTGLTISTVTRTSITQFRVAFTQTAIFTANSIMKGNRYIFIRRRTLRPHMQTRIRTRHFTRPANISMHNTNRRSRPRGTSTNRLRNRRLLNRQPSQHRMTGRNRPNRRTSTRPRHVFNQATRGFIRTPQHDLRFSPLITLTFNSFLTPRRRPHPQTLQTNMATPSTTNRRNSHGRARHNGSRRYQRRSRVLQPRNDTRSIRFTFQRIPRRHLTTTPIRPRHTRRYRGRRTNTTSARITRRTNRTTNISRIITKLNLRL